VDGIRKIGSKKGKEEYDFTFVCGALVVSFLILLAMPCLLRLSNESLTAKRSYGSTLFQPPKENRVVKKSSKYSAALLLAKVGIERAVWELNYGDISSWSGDESLRTMTISSFNTPDGDVIGDIDVRVENPGTDNPVVEATGNSQMVWNSNTQFFGAVYVPRADVVFDSDVDFYGSMAGKYLGEY